MPDASPRLVDQRLRNRIIEQLQGLRRGDAEVREFGGNNYINGFFDGMPLEDDAPLKNSAMTAEEIAAVEDVRALMIQATLNTAQSLADEDFIAGGWPARIAPPAADALNLLMTRGRFSEDFEEIEPASPSNTART